MKTLLRIFVVLFVLLLVALVGGYFTLTNAGFQKHLVEGQLPEGSSIEAVHLTTGKVTLSGLVLMLEDGTRVQVGAVDTAFDPFAAFFDQTVKLGVLQVEGLRVDLPVATAPTPSTEATVAGTPSPRVEATAPEPVAPVEEAANPMEVLYALGDFEWLLDIEGIDVGGVIYDGQGSMYMVRVNAPAIRPGEASKIDASLQLLSDVPLPSGLKAFDSTATLSFKQKAAGGFESLKLESNTSGKDAHDNRLISVKQALDLAVDDAAGEATVSVSFDADLPKPQVLAPELAELGTLKVTGNTVASTDGETMTVSAADLIVSVANREVVALDLKHSMFLGGSQTLSGELLDLSITELPLEWLNPWLSGGLHLQSQVPVSLALSVTGAPDGAFAVTVAEPITLGPLTVTDGGELLLQDVTVSVVPTLQLSADQSLQYSLNALNVADRYGSFIQGSSSGVIQLDAARDAMNPFAGVQSQTTLEIGLQELFQLPVLAGSASIVSGRLAVDLNVNDEAKNPLLVAADIKGLRARSLPSMIRDYSVAVGVKPTSNLGEWGMSANILAGPSSRPSTELEFRGVVNASREPLTFEADLSGPRVTEHDISILSAAFTPREEAETLSAPTPSRPSDVRSAPRPKAPGAGRVGAVVPAEPVPPAWAAVNGSVSLSIDEFSLDAGQVIEAIRMKAIVSEPELRVDPISAKIGEGELNGSSTVLYAPAQLKPYSLTTAIHFEGVDPAFFVKKYQNPPVQGLFDGEFELAGVGETLDGAIEDSTAMLKVTGKQGILTAFKLDGYKQVGLGFVGDILGQALDRPGISALSHAIPYFKDIPFDSFVFELTRGQDKHVQVPQLKLIGESVLLDASGTVGPSALSEVVDQPLDLTLSLGARGQLAEYLDILDLLQSSAGEDGYTRFSEDIKVPGTLADPDTSGLMDLLNDAAKGAYSKSKKPKQESTETDSSNESAADLAPHSEGAALEAEEPKKKSKEERRREDIEQGLELINSLFGN